MSWNPLSLFKTIDKIVDLGSEVIEDKDKRNELSAMIEKVKEEASLAKEELEAQIHIAGLNTKTVPWVDALHKMQRFILSVLSMGITVYMIHKGVTDPIALASGLVPAGGYNIIKGKGR
jgi:hypothetical protein